MRCWVVVMCENGTACGEFPTVVDGGGDVGGGSESSRWWVVVMWEHGPAWRESIVSFIWIIPL